MRELSVHTCVRGEEEVESKGDGRQVYGGTPRFLLGDVSWWLHGYGGRTRAGLDD